MARAKGASLLGAVKWLRHDREAALRALPARLHPYLDARIQVASWYPEEDLLELIRALARILPANGADVYEQMGRFSARDQLAGSTVICWRAATNSRCPDAGSCSGRASTTADASA